MKTTTTKEIIFDSKNLPVNIDEAEWVLNSDYLMFEEQVNKLVEFFKEFQRVAIKTDSKGFFVTTLEVDQILADFKAWKEKP